MRLRASYSGAFAFAVLFVDAVAASWIPDIFSEFNHVQTLEKRCANPCGYQGWLCCGQGQTCYTDTQGQAQCGTAVTGAGTGTGSGSGTGNGQWQYFTTTYVQTDLTTMTKTYSSWVAGQTAAPTGATCSYSNGESPCGNVCCHANQYCMTPGSCAAVPGGSSGFYSSFYTVTTVITQTAGPGIRPTTETIVTITSTGVATGTAPFQTPVGTGGAVLTGPEPSSGGLSGGAIAGIVIGVIAGIIILILICVCCCFKGLLDGLLAIFGLGGRKKRTEETYIEERHSRRTGGGVRRWFGQGPAKTEVVDEKKKKSSGINKFLGAGAFLGTLALVLGLKRKRDDRDDRSTGYYGSSYYTYDSSSSSSQSSVSRSRSRSRSRYSRR